MLYDQFGYPIKPGIDWKDGYKRVSKGKYRDFDPRTGISRWLIFNSDGSVTVRVTQDVSPLVKFANHAKENHKRIDKRPMQRQAIIPHHELMDMKKRCGWKPGTDANAYDEKRLDRILNDSNEAVFKTRPGRISVCKTVWY